MPREVESTSIGDIPRDDLSLGDAMLGLAAGSAVESSVRTCKLALAAAANGETTLDLPCVAKGDTKLRWAGSAAGASELAGTAAKDEVEAGSVSDAAGTSATGCHFFLLPPPPPPNLLLGGAEVNSSPPGKLGMPAKRLLGALLAALLGLGLLSGLVGGGGALWGSGEGSRGSAAPATALLAAMFRLP